MKNIKITDTERFRIHPFKNRDAVTISVLDVRGFPRMLTTLWGVRGGNAVTEYCEAFIEARRNMQTLLDIEQRYSSESARINAEVPEKYDEPMTVDEIAGYFKDSE